eukprot:EG_transcript_31845
MPNLCVATRFNPPVICLMGATLREETVRRIEALVPKMTSTSYSPKQEPPKFEYIANPPHWRLELTNQHSDHTSRSFIMLSIIESLEAEDWKLKAAHGITHNSHVWQSTDAGMDTTRLFFHRN